MGCTHYHLLAKMNIQDQDHRNYMAYSRDRLEHDSEEVWRIFIELRKYRKEIEKINYIQRVQDKYEKEYEEFDKKQIFHFGSSLISFKEFIYVQREHMKFFACYRIRISNPMHFAVMYQQVGDTVYKSEFGDNPRKAMDEKFKKDYY